MRKIDYFRHPSLFLLWLDKRHLIRLNDKRYVKLKYYEHFGRWPDFKNPRRLTEKLQILKLTDHNPSYVNMVDKYEAKKYVAKIIGKEYIIPTLGVYDSWEEIDFSKLPDKFVVKCTHDSGSVIICRDKKSFDYDSAKELINRQLNINYYRSSREWPYKDVKPRIIIEEYMEDAHSKTMRDYKFFCFSGVPKIMYLSEGLEDHTTASMSFYDMDFKVTSCRRSDYKPLSYTPKKPKNFEKMKEFARRLSKGIPHVRVDFYEVNGKLYFGELTFFTGSGFIPFEDEKWDYRMGDWLEMPSIKSERGL